MTQTLSLALQIIKAVGQISVIGIGEVVVVLDQVNHRRIHQRNLVVVQIKLGFHQKNLIVVRIKLGFHQKNLIVVRIKLRVNRIVAVDVVHSSTRGLMIVHFVMKRVMGLSIVHSGMRLTHVQFVVWGVIVETIVLIF
jgi:hypothetical protein